MKMENIEIFQSEYYKILLKYKEKVELNNLNRREISHLLDEIKSFWLKRKDLIEFELLETTKSNDCFLLCGAVYLRMKDNQHYYFKSLGNCHFLSDPFLKLENYFRLPEEYAIDTSAIDYFIKVFYDIINILENYSDYFYILPIHEIIISDQEEYKAVIGELFIESISEIFKKEFSDGLEFCKIFRTFEEIEKGLDSGMSRVFVYNFEEDPSLPLRVKVLNYFKNQMSVPEIAKKMSEPELFLFATFAYFSQFLDLMNICISLKMSPYIRSNLTFHYFFHFMENFADDLVSRNIIENGIIFYIFAKTIKENQLVKHEFEKYCSHIKKMDSLSRIKEEIKRREINIFENEFEKLQTIILDEFKCII
ncbi:hypothetical protein LEP1GSC071_0256 [Leptospira santarosai str. JET]|nr:hypothetical protein LEP1GSC071_0256 [Leptospira santarosai str. JET]